MHMVVAQLLALLGVAQVTSSGGFSLGAGRSFGFYRDPVDNSVVAMGLNSYGQLGVDTPNQTEPLPLVVTLPGGAAIADVAAGTFHTLFVSDSGAAYSAGRNNFGQLGYSTEDSRQVGVPEKIEGLAEGDAEDPNVTIPTVTAAAAGYGHSLFLLSDGSVRSVGLNNYGQLGGTEESRTKFVTPSFAEPIKAIAAGYDFSYFLTVSGDVYASGNNLGGQLGDGTRDPRASPVKILSNVTAISAGEAHGVFLTTSASVLATGANFDGQVGANVAFVVSPTEIVSQDATGICAGGDSTTLLSGESQQLWGLGSNRLGQLALGNVTTTATKMQIGVMEAEDMRFSEAAVGDDHGLFLTEGNFVYTSGYNLFGQLGDGTYEPSVRLVEIYKYEPITHTSTSTETEPWTATETTTSEGPPVSTTTSGATNTATATNTDTRGGQSSAGIGLWGRIAIVCIVILVVVAGVLADCACKRRKEGAQSQDEPQVEMKTGPQHSV